MRIFILLFLFPILVFSQSKKHDKYYKYKEFANFSDRIDYLYKWEGKAKISNKAFVNHEIAETFLEMGDYQMAAPYVNRAWKLKFFSEGVNPFISIAENLEEEERYQEAIWAFKDAYPKDSDTLVFNQHKNRILGKWEASLGPKKWTVTFEIGYKYSKDTSGLGNRKIHIYKDSVLYDSVYTDNRGVVPYGPFPLDPSAVYSFMVKDLAGHIIAYNPLPQHEFNSTGINFFEKIYIDRELEKERLQKPPKKKVVRLVPLND